MDNLHLKDLAQAINDSVYDNYHFDEIANILHFRFTKPPSIFKIEPYLVEPIDEDPNIGIISLFIHWDNGASLLYSQGLHNSANHIKNHPYHSGGFHTAGHFPEVLIPDEDNDELYHLQSYWDDEFYPPKLGDSNADMNMLSYLDHIGIMDFDFINKRFTVSDILDGPPKDFFKP